MSDSWRDRAVENSAIVEAITAVRERLRASTNSARAVQTARKRFGNRVDSQSQDSPSQLDTDETAAESSQPERDGQTAESNLSRGSATYRVLGNLKQTTQSSRLVRWLTAEPEPEVITIDLRTTRLIGPILAQIDRTVSELAPATTRSRLVTFGYRTSARFRERPVRLLSFVVIALTLPTLALTATTTEQFSAISVGLIVVLLLALRGTRSERSWDAMATSGWAKRLAAAFAPPEPPSTPSEEEPGQPDDED